MALFTTLGFINQEKVDLEKNTFEVKIVLQEVVLVTPEKCTLSKPLDERRFQTYECEYDKMGRAS